MHRAREPVAAKDPGRIQRRDDGRDGEGSLGYFGEARRGPTAGASRSLPAAGGGFRQHPGRKSLDAPSTPADGPSRESFEAPMRYSRSSVDPIEHLRRGDPAGWPHLRPEPLSEAEVLDRFSEAREQPFAPTVQAYLHFAYCVQSCAFCMYHHQVTQDDATFGRYADYLVARLDRYRARFGQLGIANAYLGGGTPSAMPEPAFGRVLRAFREAFMVRGELCSEAHPRDLKAAWVSRAADHGINRLSVGIQSLHDQVLRTITRRNAGLTEMSEALDEAQRKNIAVNIDLVLGLPKQTLSSFREDLRRILALRPETITVYRYQPTKKLPNGSPLTYRQAFDGATLRAAVRAGYLPAIPPGHTNSARLVRNTPAMRRRLRSFGRHWMGRRIGRAEAAPGYALFEDFPSHLIGIGPGAYGHVFGALWYRETTALDALDAGPKYFGTRMGQGDECKERVLRGLHRGVVDLRRVERETGVRPEKRFSELNGPEFRALGSLRIPKGDAAHRLGERWFPAHQTAPVSERALTGVDRSLVRLRAGPRGDSPHLQAFRSTLGIPKKGYRYQNAWVRDSDERSIFFAVEQKDGPALRVLVSAPDDAPSFAKNARFAIGYGSRPEPLTAAEEQFLESLGRAVEGIPA
ncbi:MAG: radical SAM protein [Myxococcota bacterium]